MEQNYNEFCCPCNEDVPLQCANELSIKTREVNNTFAQYFSLGSDL